MYDIFKLLTFYSGVIVRPPSSGAKIVLGLIKLIKKPNKFIYSITK